MAERLGRDRGANAGVWARISADAELGLIYLPVEAPFADTYGGERPGTNLYGNSLVCLDAKTGEKVWHYQLIHHDIWDWDNPTAPILMDIVVDGKPVKAVAQITKQSWVYTFDRTNGTPVWPIEERAVKAGDVPGEWYSPTQPFPTKPPAFDRQGVTDGRPDRLHARAARRGARGDEGLPDGADLHAAVARDDGRRHSRHDRAAELHGRRELGRRLVRSRDERALRRLVYAAERRGAAARAEFLEHAATSRAAARRCRSSTGLPLIKPPWGRITAIDMNKGEHLFQIPNGPTPKEIAEHPKLKGLDIAPTGRATRPVVLVTKSLLFSAEGWGGTPALRAHDKATGEVLADIPLPGQWVGCRCPT